MTAAVHAERWKVRKTAAKRRRLAVWLKGDGIEIGALHRPLAVPRDVHVRYVDRMTEAELRQHYPELHGQPFAPVSIIGSAYDLSQIPNRSLDFVIANHLVEHLEYPMKGLKEFERVLRSGAVLYLALPDQRVGIDQDRPLTSLSHLLQEQQNGADGSRRLHYLEWVTQSEKQLDDPDKRAEWLMDIDYSIHFHVWRPDTFLEFLLAAKQEVCLDLDIVAFAPPEFPGDDEFILILVKGPAETVPLPPRVQGISLRERVVRSRIGPALRPWYRLLKRSGRRLLRR